MNRFPNWNWDDGTPEDGPRIQPRFDEAEIATMREFPELEDPEKDIECEMKSWNAMNILEYIDWLIEQGISEANAEEIASSEFNLN